jgi:hypothetical protein
MTLWIVVLGGCDAGDGGAGGLFRTTERGGERWTIRCQRFEGPEHELRAETMARMLREVDGLKRDRVRVATDPSGSTLYYGEYRQVASSETGGWAFPPSMKQDMDLIQRLTLNRQMPFALAYPELIDKEASGDAGKWHISHCRGTHSLLIAIFYNTPTFNQRREVAEQYARQLREEGYPAYYYHEQVRSQVTVGDFEESDLIRTPDGGWRLGPRVENLIARNEEAFRYVYENGYLPKSRMPDGQVAAPMSYLVRVPRDARSGGWPQ